MKYLVDPFFVYLFDNENLVRRDTFKIYFNNLGNKIDRKIKNA